MNSFRRPAPWLLLLAALAAAPAQAAPELPETTRSQLETAFQAVDAATIKGPTDVAIAGQAVLQLPSGYHFVPAEPARQLLAAMGNPGADHVQGMIFPAREQEAPWFIVVSFNPAGYIKDDEAKDWKADALLEEIRKGTATANEERRTRGLPELTVAGWVEAPQYDPETHRLVWSLSSRLSGNDQPSGVNYNTLMLGREGYISLNLVTDLASIERLKPVARNMLASLEFDAGKRYADFQPDTDKVAEYGLAALVAGVAAKKLGLLALAGVFFAKFAKVILAGAVVAMGGFAKVFGRKKKPEA
ncbi:DUF2167 domain-containing protein [Methylomagnum ishizawai]|uniref:DUF2167 domain-containing protein n=1 Tax=Methylomagnum ishizawai TaxID=1760988 RepID=UPI001C31FA28|nr:DUF2167 domain-containing protein [Methylomagnum ishizawai]BBL75634.1 membrane protein [Methylomagnum ishizawai]